MVVVNMTAAEDGQGKEENRSKGKTRARNAC
jgi:hypothetical protein